MKKWIIILILIAFGFVHLFAGTTLTVLKIDADNTLHLKSTENKYYTASPQVGSGSFQENKNYSGDILSDKTLQIVDDTGASYTFNYILAADASINNNDNSTQAVDNGVNWWLVGGVVAVIALLASRSMHNSGSSGGGGGGSAPAY